MPKKVFLLEFLMINKHLVVKEGFLVLIGQIVSISSSLLLIRVTTENMAPAEFGQFGLCLTVSSLVHQILMGGLVNGVSRHFSIAVEQNDVKSYHAAVLRLTLAYSLAAVALFIPLLLFLLVGKLWKWSIVLIGAKVLALVSGLNSVISNYLIVSHSRLIAVLIYSVESVLRVVSVFVFLKMDGNPLLLAINGYGVASSLALIMHMICVRNRLETAGSNSEAASKWVKDIWKYSWPFSLWGVFTWIQQASDRWSLQFFGNSNDVGLFIAVFQIGYAPIALCGNLLTNLLSPIMYRIAGDAKDRSRNVVIHNGAWGVVCIILILSVGLYVVSKQMHQTLLRPFLAAEYRVGSEYLPYLIIAGGLFSAGQVLALKLMTDMEISRIQIVKIGSAIIGVALNILGAAFGGVFGVVLSSVLSSVVYFVWIAFASSRGVGQGNASRS